jgi:glycosyltransferase involved in cell wall biosynthesis
MTIGLVLYPLGNERGSGLGRMAYALAREMIRQHPEHRYLVFTKGPIEEIFDFGPNVDMYEGRGILWLDRLLWRSPRADVYYFSTPVLPLLWTPQHSVATVLDFAYLSPYTNVRGIRKLLIRTMHWWSLRRAVAVIAISEFAKRETVRLFGVASKKVSVVYLGVNDVCAAAPEAVDVPEPFLLYAGGMKERKNVKNIVRAFAAAFKDGGPALVLTGGTGGEFGQSVKQLAHELGVEKRAHFVGTVSSGGLSYLYGHALGFVFPSRLEGFGMAPLEAMACGVPTIASNSSSLPEVVGDAALVVGTEDVPALAAAMSRLYGDQALRADLIVRGHKRVAAFSWSKSAAETYTILTAPYA